MDDFRLELYKTWAPPESVWSGWAKPALFASMVRGDMGQTALPELLPAEWARDASKSTAIIIDLPGEQAVLNALSLVDRGYRPVPLFNGCKAPGMLVDVAPVVKALVAGSQILSRGEKLRRDSAPVFVLDSRRMESSQVTDVKKYDNRWSVVPQDMPSAQYLRQMGIDRIIVRSDRIREDLAHILLRYQEERITIQMCGDGQRVESLTVRKPPLFGSLWYRWSVFFGLKRNSTGGFGSYLPPVHTPGSSSGTMFYGSRMG